jgi:hypothetical protein
MLCPRLDRGIASDLELTNHLNRGGAGLWLSDRVASKHGARGAFGIHGVAFSLLIPHLPIGPAGTVVLARWTPGPVIAAAVWTSLWVLRQ